MNREPMELVFETDSPTETEEAGEIVGRALRGGEMIGLEGELGTGKTTFIRGLARGLGIPDHSISSPTFVFAHEHRGRRSLAHLDLFRTESATDLADLGALDYLDGQWVVVIEWADRAAGFLSDNRLTVRIREIRPDRRQLILRTPNPIYADLFELLRGRFCTLGKSRKS